MPKLTVPAAGEAMPAAEGMPIIGRFSRRVLLGAIASIPATAGATALKVTVVDADPLADAIAEYHAQMAEFMAIPVDEITNENEAALVAATYEPAMNLLWHDTPPATSNHGVAEAVRYALDTNSLIDRMAEAVLRSALTYLDGTRS